MPWYQTSFVHTDQMYRESFPYPYPNMTGMTQSVAGCLFSSFTFEVVHIKLVLVGANIWIVSMSHCEFQVDITRADYEGDFILTKKPHFYHQLSPSFRALWFIISENNMLVSKRCACSVQVHEYEFEYALLGSVICGIIAFWGFVIRGGSVTWVPFGVFSSGFWWRAGCCWQPLWFWFVGVDWTGWIDFKWATGGVLTKFWCADTRVVGRLSYGVFKWRTTWFLLRQPPFRFGLLGLQ